MGKTCKIPAWQLTKVRHKTEVIAEATKKGKTAHFCVVNGHLSSQECGVGAKISEIQRPNSIPR